MSAAAIFLAASMCVLGVGGGPSDGSTAIPMPAADAARMAQATTALLAEQMPPANSVVILKDAAGCARGDTYSPALALSLRQAGFALAVDGQPTPGAHLVRYHVSAPWEDSVLLRVQLDNRETSQLFTRGLDGVLREAGPLSVRTVQ